MTRFITFLVPLLTVIAAIVYGRLNTRTRTVEEWAIGGRRLGLLIFWFVNAGEIYTTFAVLGVSGFAWAYGAPAYISFTSVSLASAIAYWMMPRIWETGRRHGLVTQADFFGRMYAAPWLSVIVALAGLFATVIYVEIQLTALSLVLQLALGSTLGNGASVALAAAAMLAFVFTSGLRSAAFAAGVKDVMMIVLVVVLSATAASRAGTSSLLDVFRLVELRHPGIGSFPGLRPAAGLGTTWFITQSLSAACGTWFFPHMFQLSYAASGPRALRQNAIWQPLYSLSYFLIIALGFAALLSGAALPGTDPNRVLLQFVTERYPSRVIGLLAGTASLLALVPGSVLLMTAGSIFARNIVKPVISTLSEDASLTVSRISMVGLAAVAAYLALGTHQSIVKIGLSAYAATSMLAPGAVLVLIWPRTQPWAAVAGIAVGYVAMFHPAALVLWARIAPGWEPGFIALILNAMTAVLVSLLLAATPGRMGSAVRVADQRRKELQGNDR